MKYNRHWPKWKKRLWLGWRGWQWMMNGAPPGRIYPDHKAEKQIREDFPSLKKD